jgi:4,5-dihydroxyphthalate decarboxylase
MAIQRFDRTAALHTRTVTIDDVMVLQVLPGVGVPGLLNGTFDAAEIPLAHYAFMRDRGAPYVGLPVFPDRIFTQQYVYTRSDTGIRSLADLRGRRVGVPMYFMTSSVWHKGILKDEHGISPSEIEWFTVVPEKEGMDIPKGVKVTVKPGPWLGQQLLLDGTVDCVMSEGTPIVPEDQRHRVVNVYKDPHATQKDYFSRTKFHPAVHVIAVRKSVVEERPSILLELCEAFDRAKQSAYYLLQNERMTGLPLMRTCLDETVAVFGDDPWPYGASGRNRAEIDQFLAYALDQGLIHKRLTTDDLFEPPVREFEFQSRMIEGGDLGGPDSLYGYLPAES